MIIKQPNGLYCIYSNIVDAFIACNLTKEDLFVELLSNQIMGIIHSIKRVDEKGTDPNLLEMIVDAKQQRKEGDIEFLEAFEKTFNEPVQQETQETARNIVNNLQLYLKECDSVLLERFQAFFDTSNSD